MFNPKTKSIRVKPDSPAAPTTTNSTNDTKSSSSSKGLLSFNASNFTKLFKNSSNFVQTTFGNSSTVAVHQSSNLSSSFPEQSFTIPSYKKHNDTSNHVNVKKERDILSTPVLIAPMVTTSTSSVSALVTSLPSSTSSPLPLPLNAPNYITITNGTATGIALVKPRMVERKLSEKLQKSNKFDGNNRNTIPPLTTATAIIASNSSHTNAIISANAKTTASTQSLDTIQKKNNESIILFETVKLNKIGSTVPSSTISSHQLDSKLSFNTIDNQRKGDTDGKRNDRIGDNKKLPSQKELNNSMNMSRMKNDKNIPISTINISSPVIASTSYSLLPTLATTELQSNHITNFNSNSKNNFDNASKGGGNMILSTLDNDISNKMLNGDGVSSYNGINNNLDYNLQECIAQMEADNPFDSSSTKLNYLDKITNPSIEPPFTIRYKPNNSSESKHNEYYYENYVPIPKEKTTSESGNYQQDSNENIISAPKINTSTINITTTSAINNNNNNTINTNCVASKKVNNNNISNNSSNSSSTSTNTNTNILLSNYNQNFIITKTTELHDIQEVDGDDEQQIDDEHAFANRYSNWNTTKNNHFPILASSFAAAASAHDITPTNRNPFLQLMAASSTSHPNTIQSVPSSSETTSASMFFKSANNVTVSQSPLPSMTNNNNNNNNNDTCVAFSMNEPNKLFASLSSSSSPFTVAAATEVTNNGIDSKLTTIHQKQQIQLNNFIEPDFELNTVNSNSTQLQVITPDVMNTLQLFLKEHGNEYIKQFFQVI